MEKTEAIIEQATRIYFSDIFSVSPDLIEQYGAFNISPRHDLPLFVDPFLLFGSKKPEYQDLHRKILDYLVFLKEKSRTGIELIAQIKSWYLFQEVKQNCFGYSVFGTNGHGLGMKFGKAFSSSMHIVFEDLGNETITETSHLEKAALFRTGVGRDNISDFTTNLIKEFLLDYTQRFALEHIAGEFLETRSVNKVYFDYDLERWMPKVYTLPIFNDEFVLLTPKDILTIDDTWINRHDFNEDFRSICNSIPDDQLRNEINNYFESILPKRDQRKRTTKKDIAVAIQATIDKYPELINWFIKRKEDNKSRARSIADSRVKEVDNRFVIQLSELLSLLLKKSDYFAINPYDSYEEALKRVMYFKDVVENKDGYKLFYHDNKPITKESDLQIYFRFVWYGTCFDVNREPNNGRGPVDYKVSMGAKDSTLVEFKMAKSTKLKSGLETQIGIYETANNTKKSIAVIFYFDDKQLERAEGILKELKLESKENVVLIDAVPKLSASNVK